MKASDIEWWEQFRKTKSTKLLRSELEEIARMHSEYFEHKYHVPCGCSPKKIQKWIDDLNAIYDFRGDK